MGFSAPRHCIRCGAQSLALREKNQSSLPIAALSARCHCLKYSKNSHFRTLTQHCSRFYLFSYLRFIRSFHILLSTYLKDKNLRVKKAKPLSSSRFKKSKYLVKAKTSDSVVANNVWRNLIDEHGVQHMDRKLPLIPWHLAAQETSRGNAVKSCIRFYNTSCESCACVGNHCGVALETRT